jgi:DNA-binding response OmpR family regulator
VKKVLIIEDDRDTLDAIHYIAEDLNLEVINSASVLQVDEIKVISPNLILMDHWVGNKLGGDLCLSLKSDPFTKHIPVVILSAHNNIRQIAERSCADTFLAKPFDIDELTDIINSFVG